MKSAELRDSESFLITLQGINISPKNGMLKMIFLFPRWDMLISWRVILTLVDLQPSEVRLSQYCEGSGLLDLVHLTPVQPSDKNLQVEEVPHLDMEKRGGFYAHSTRKNVKKKTCSGEITACRKNNKSVGCA